MFKAILYVTLALIVQSNAQCENATFKCLDNGNDRAVYINGVPFTCPIDEVCNRHGIEPCNPCVNLLEECQKSYECSPYDKHVVLLGEFNYEVYCPENYECNLEHSAECVPCIITKCYPDQIKFQCNDSDSYKVIYDGIEFQCPAGTKCNNEEISPCIGCIPDRPAYFPSEMKTAAAAATAYRPNFENCNDGATNACHAGEVGSDRYYRCVWTPLGFVAQWKSCVHKWFDGICRFDRTICQQP